MSQLDGLSLLLIMVVVRCGTGTDGKPDCFTTGVRCYVNTYVTHNEINVSWTTSFDETDYVDEILIFDIRLYDVSCNCSTSNYYPNEEMHPKDPPFFHVMEPFSNSVCFGQCLCHVKAVARDPNGYCAENFTDPVSCYIGPTAPRSPPIIISNPVRSGSDGKTVSVDFKLPPVESQYCDSPEKGVKVLARIYHGNSYQIGPISPTKHDAGIYSMSVRANHTHTWKPFYISIAVVNSVGPSNFTNPLTVRGAINADITRNEYKLEVMANSTNSLQLYWSIKNTKIDDMLEISFIRGLSYTIHALDGSYNLTDFTNPTNLTINVTLNICQWYSVIVQMITTDNSSWYPEPSFSHFMIPQGACKMENSNSHLFYAGDNSRVCDKQFPAWMLILLLCSTLLLTAVLSTLVIVYMIIRLRLVTCCTAMEDDSHNSDKHSIEEPETVTDSYANYMRERSIVENVYSQLPTHDVANSDDVASYEDVASISDDINIECLETVT